MTADEWASLQACTGWYAMRRYLLDSRGQIMEMMAEGKCDDMPMAIANCQVRKDIATLEWADIERFYATPEEPPKANEEEYEI